MIPDSALDILQSFDGDGRILLSAYLHLETPEQWESAYVEFNKQIQARLEECYPQSECREAIKEDMEIVNLYLKTNGRRRNKGLAIFSCAAKLFWRAYPLSEPVPTQVTVGPEFDLDPLLQTELASDKE